MEAILCDWWWNSTGHNNAKKKSTKDRICQLQWGNKNMGKQKDVGLIKNARHSSLICESGRAWRLGDKWNDWHVMEDHVYLSYYDCYLFIRGKNKRIQWENRWKHRGRLGNWVEADRTESKVNRTVPSSSETFAQHSWSCTEMIRNKSRRLWSVTPHRRFDKVERKQLFNWEMSH